MAYRDANAQEAARLAEEAASRFEKAVSMRETGDSYVRITVFLAVVLFLTALSQRFSGLAPRVIVVGVAFLLLILSAYWIAILPRA